MQGRSSVMKEGIRSTRPVTELAVNVLHLHRLAPTAEFHDHRELLSLGLLEWMERDGEEWLEVRYNHVESPRPYVRLCDSREEEFAALAADLKRLVTREFVSPADVCLLYNGAWVRERLERELGPRLAKIGVELSVQTNRPFERRPGTLVATTPHSYKGYDAEVVLVPCADNYAGGGGEPLASGLYVAMTRARSVLGVYSTRGAGDAARRINDALERCDRLLRSAPAVDPESGRDGRSELEDVILQTDPQTNP